jgi:hypothetical protein
MFKVYQKLKNSQKTVKIISRNLQEIA